MTLVEINIGCRRMNELVQLRLVAKHSPLVHGGQRVRALLHGGGEAADSSVKGGHK